MARKGQFKKGGGRVGGGSSGGRKSKSRAIVVAPPRTIVVRAPAKRRSSGLSHHHAVGMVVQRKSKSVKHHRRGGGNGGVTIAKIAIAGLVLGAACETKASPFGATVFEQVQKLPGVKTLGGAATAGLALGAVYKFTRFGGKYRPWLAAAGIVGTVVAAVKVGTQNKDFKWLGGYDDDRRRASDGYMDVET